MAAPRTREGSQGDLDQLGTRIFCEGDLEHFKASPIAKLHNSQPPLDSSHHDSRQPSGATAFLTECRVALDCAVHGSEQIVFLDIAAPRPFCSTIRLSYPPVPLHHLRPLLPDLFAQHDDAAETVGTACVTPCHAVVAVKHSAGCEVCANPAGLAYRSPATISEILLATRA